MHRRAARRIGIGTSVLVISLCVTFLVLYFFMPRFVARPAVAYEQTVDNSHNVTMPTVVSAPKQLHIDSIDITAAIKPVGLTQSGDMDIDDNPTELAWYQFGPKPGEVGSAVVAGHYGWKNNTPSVFNDLNKLSKGDRISVYDQAGKEMQFVVTRTALYDPDQDATDVFRSADGKAHLNLITCQGTWLNSEQSYTKRLVVFTDYIE